MPEEQSMNSRPPLKMICPTLILSTAILLFVSQTVLGYQSTARKETADPYFQPPKTQVPKAIDNGKDWSQDFAPSKPLETTPIPKNPIKNGSIIREKPNSTTWPENPVVPKNPQIEKKVTPFGPDVVTTTPWGRSQLAKPLTERIASLGAHPAPSRTVSGPLRPALNTMPKITELGESRKTQQLEPVASTTELPDNSLKPVHELTPSAEPTGKNDWQKNSPPIRPNNFLEPSNSAQTTDSAPTELPKLQTNYPDQNKIKNNFFAESGSRKSTLDEENNDFQPRSSTLKPTPNIDLHAEQLSSKPKSNVQPTAPAAKTPTDSPVGTRSLEGDKQIGGLTTPGFEDANKTQLPETFEPGRVLALVGGDPIFVADILFEVNQIIQKYAPTAPESFRKQQRPALIKRLLPNFIDSRLLYVSTVQGLPEQADLDKILEQADAEFDEKALDKMMEQMNVKSPTEFDAHLRSMGSSLRQLRRNWSKEQLVRFFLSQQLKVDTEVSHQEMLDYYREHESDYILKPRAKWEQVMVRFDKFPTRQEAHNAIVDMGNKIVYGAKLDAVAKQNSHGYLADEGGQHDWTSKGALVLKEIDKAIFETPIGTLSDIIESRDGYHILRVTARDEQTKKSFLDAQIEIKEKLADEKRNAAFQKHLANLKKEIPVEIFEVSTEPEKMGQSNTLGK